MGRTVEEIAKVCHEANRAWCEVLGDNSQEPWEDAEQWQRDSAIAGVRFRLANPGASASAQHESWMAAKLADGWKFGPEKDAAAKAHPCLVPYGNLPPEQRAKDYLFMGIVEALRDHVD